MHPEAPKPKHRVLLARVCVVLLLCLGGAWVSRIPTNPDRDLTEVLAMAEDGAGRTGRFEHKGAYVQFHPLGYILTLCVRGDERFAPAEFLTVVSTSGDLSASQMIPDGETSRQVSFSGPALDSYLEGVHLDLAPVDLIYRRYYKGAEVRQRGK